MHKLFLKNTDFYDEYCCTGTQVAFILEQIYNFDDTLKWYAFDLIFGIKEIDGAFLYEISNNTESEIENFKEFIQKISNVTQFDSGVFMAFENNAKPKWAANIRPLTEENEGLQHTEAIIEIRMFDYSTIEVYTRDEKYLDIIKKGIDEHYN